jgi:DNA polymerase V
MTMTPITPSPHPPAAPLPFYLSKVAAGFPSPADDYIEQPLDLNALLVPNKTSTFFLSASGDSMKNAGILDGDLLVVDRSIPPAHCDIIVAVINAEFTVKTLFKRGDVVKLVPANETYPEIVLQPGQELEIFGVVTDAIHRFRKPVRAGRRQ